MNQETDVNIEPLKNIKRGGIKNYLKADTTTRDP